MSSTTGVKAGAARPWSLALRLTAWYGVSAFLLIAMASAFLYAVLVRNLDREDDEFLADKVHLLRALLSEPTRATMLQEEVEWEPRARQYNQVLIRILDERGRSLLQTPGMMMLPPELFPPAAAPDAEPASGSEVTVSDGRSFRLVAAQAALGHEGRVIQIAMDRTREEALLATYRRYLWAALAAALVICLVVGHQIARRGLQPVVAITAAAGRVRSTTLGERLQLPGLPAELADLAGTFNEMLDRLEESFQRLERFSADIAHELRTPVNNLRGEAEVALGKSRSPEEYREVLASCLEECERLARLIDSLLFLARAENPQDSRPRERCDLREELALIRDLYEPAAAEAGVQLTLQAPEGLSALLDRTLFQRAIGNLVQNSLAHTPSGGHIQLRAAAEGTEVCLEVIDDGEGVAPEDLPHVFDRFYRADRARSTAAGRVGLGLPIVRSIAGLHRGTVAIASEPGKGTRVTLRLPRQGGNETPVQPARS